MSEVQGHVSNLNGGILWHSNPQGFGMSCVTRVGRGSWTGHRCEGGPYSNMTSEAWRRQLEASGGRLLCVTLLASRRRCFRWEKLMGSTNLQKLDRSISARNQKMEKRLWRLVEKLKYIILPFNRLMLRIKGTMVSCPQVVPRVDNSSWTRACSTAMLANALRLHFALFS